MPSKRLDEIRDYAFADQALALRKRTGLTQIELAHRLGVTNQSVYAWEAGLSYPGAERLKQLLAFYREHGALNSGREVEHAEEVWETVRARATRRMEPFDPAWFTSPVVTDHSATRRDLPPTNLPVSRTRFIGREDAITALRTSLENTWEMGGRLLTLIGVAGCGKTRLALAVAESVQATYPGGVWFVELAPLPASSSADPADIASAVLTTLPLRDLPDRSPLETLIGHLESQRVLLVLDNCEHVVVACGALATRLLAACPQVQLLTTSQYPLGLGDETVWPVDTLSVPPLLDGEPSPELLDTVRQTEAVQLFMDRARVVQPGFAVTLANAASIAAICRELDGLPLAIELAAARLNLLAPEELLGRLTNRFAVLRRGGRTVVDRHQTLQATMDWSYRLLDPSDQAVLRRLAVFAGGWDLEAAEAVARDDLTAAEAILEALDELQARSLIFVETADTVSRYGMLETVRHYGLQQMHRTGETTTVHERHLNWCVALTEQAAIGLRGQEQVAWFARLDREQDNLRAGMQWALDRGLAEPGLRVATGLWMYWRGRHRGNEGRRWLEALLAIADGGELDPAVRANALEGAA